MLSQWVPDDLAKAISPVYHSRHVDRTHTTEISNGGNQRGLVGNCRRRLLGHVRGKPLSLSLTLICRVTVVVMSRDLPSVRAGDYWGCRIHPTMHPAGSQTRKHGSWCTPHSSKEGRGAHAHVAVPFLFFFFSIGCGRALLGRSAPHRARHRDAIKARTTHRSWPFPHVVVVVELNRRAQP